MGRFQLELIIILPIFPPSSNPTVVCFQERNKQLLDFGWDEGGKICEIIMNSILVRSLEDKSVWTE